MSRLQAPAGAPRNFLCFRITLSVVSFTSGTQMGENSDVSMPKLALLRSDIVLDLSLNVLHYRATVSVPRFLVYTPTVLRRPAQS